VVAALEATEEAMVAGSAALAVDPADPGAAVRSVPAGSLSSVTSSAARAFASVCAARRDLAAPGQAEAPAVPGKLVLAGASDAGTGWCFGCWYWLVLRMLVLAGASDAGTLD